jgi:ribosomal subunit interface protein
MQIRIQTSPSRVDNVFTNEATEKLVNLQKIYERIEQCTINLKKVKDEGGKNFLVEARLVVPQGCIFAAQGAESFGRALSYVIDDLKKQLIRHKQKLNPILC